MVTKATLRGARAARQSRRDGSTEFTRLVAEGEAALASGLPQTACPYAEGSGEAEAWMFGWEG